MMHYSYGPKPIPTTSWGAPLPQNGLGEYEVPNPYVSTTHPYPTRYHGGIWTRPTFGFPRMVSVQSVFKCDDFNDGNPALRGLGEDYRVGNGVFGTAKDGGGVFGPSLYGLGSNSEDIDAIAQYILNTPTVSPAAFDLQTSFRSWYANQDGSDAALSQAQSYRDQFNAANVPGSGSPSTTAPAPSGGGGADFSPATIANLQTLLNATLTKSGYAPISSDGKIGPATCGAIQAYRQITGNPSAGASYDGICATKTPWRMPSRAGSGGGYTTARTPVSIPSSSGGGTVKAGMMGGGTWAMIAGGVLAIGVAVVGKKKGWF